MTLQTYLLPSGAAAHALERLFFMDLPGAEMGQIDFGPWHLADVCEVPSNEVWRDEGRANLGFLRTAQCMVRLDKDALVERNVAIPDEELANLASGLQRWAWRLHTLLALTETAQDRLGVVFAARELRAEAAKDGKRKKRVAGT